MSTNTTLSNLYVEKAISEHPLALWTLNEKVDYISQITEEERQFHLFDTWELTNAEATLEPEGSFNAPFPDSAVSRIIGAVPPTETQDIIATSVYNLSENLVESLYNFNIGFYVYFDTALANSVTLGYKYTDTETTEDVEVTETFLVNQVDRDTWRFFSGTFDLPPAEADDVRLIIKINVRQGGIAGDYTVFINGLSLGQWSEDFNKVSYGITTDPLPGNINLPSIMKAIPAFPYGASGDVAYYLGQGYELFAKNFGVPLVFGSSYVTKITPNVYNSNNYPSLIFPGYGFLNERGRYNDYTIEMWIRINSSSSVPRKIFGPIGSSDGLYADGAYLTFKVGDFIGSHFVGEWFRPMLVHIRELKSSMTVILNGEEVINFEIDQETLELPAEVINGKNQDWVGFYAYEDVDPVDIDTFSIYSYGIPTEVTKRRWVWGQAVASPEQTNSSINSITAFNDYAFANYASNYNYPDFANWKQAFFSNVEAESKTLRLPDYQLPSFEIGSRTTKELYDDIQAIEPDTLDPDDVALRKYLTLSPNEDWDSDTDFIYFDKLGMLNDPVQSFYGVFKTDGTEENKPLIKITNKITKDFFLISLDETTVNYSINISGNTASIVNKTIEENEKFAVGINIPTFIANRSTQINRFFSDSSMLDVYVAGDGTTKFNGRIYKVGFDAAFNSRKIFSAFDSNGTIDIADTNIVYNHTANYTLTAIDKYGIFFADIAVAGYWEDYMPLSYFGKAIIDYDGNTNFELDSIQFNQQFPEPPASLAVEEVTPWLYSDLQIEYSVPTILTYEDLNNEFYTGWQDYEDMSDNVVRTNFFQTDSSVLRSYVSFQSIANGANNSLLDFENYYRPLTSGLVDPAAIDLNWEDTAFEVTTGTIIYPPTKTQNNRPINFEDYAIVYHLDFKSDGILHHPINLRELQLASHVLERTDFTPVGSRFGIPVYYYSRSGLYYDLKAKNPIATYKKSTPYLHLNRQSGWKIRGEFSNVTDRGLAIPINLPEANDTEVSSLQLWVRFSEAEFPADPIMIFSIDHNDGIFDFYIQSDSSTQRGFIFGVDRESSEILYNLEYYVNGQSVNKIFIYNEEWSVIGIEFPDLLDFSNRTGRLSLNGPLTYNNISYNLATNIEKDETLETRSWVDMLSLHVGGVTNVTSTGTQVTYTTTNTFEPGEVITITDVVPSQYNIANAVVVSATDDTFTINSTATGSYVSGGVAKSGKWIDLQTDLVVDEDTVPPYTWQNVKIISQSRTFNIDPKTIYEKYTGSNRIVIDDESSGILVNPEKFTVYKDISWSNTIKVPA
jgi:hypothetical protein